MAVSIIERFTNVQHVFRVKDDATGDVFSDAIFYSIAEYSTKTAEELDADCMARYAKFVSLRQEAVAAQVAAEPVNIAQAEAASAPELVSLRASFESLMTQLQQSING